MTLISKETVTISRAEYLALTDERRHWRETATILVQDLMRSADTSRRVTMLGAKVPRSVVIQQLELWSSLLSDAVEGKFSPPCEGCNKPLRPGDIQFPYNDASVHADCDHPTPGKHFAGEVLKVEDAVFTDEDGNEAAGPGEVTLFATSALFTDQQITDVLAGAKAFLTPTAKDLAEPARGAA